MRQKFLRVLWASALGFLLAIPASIGVMMLANVAIGGGMLHTPPVVDMAIYLFTWFFLSRSIYWRFLHRPRKLDRLEPPQAPR